MDHFDRATGRQAVHDLLAAGAEPDALFCFNDLLAYGAIRALYEAGLRVPEDVAVVGFDDNAHDEDAVPSLTSVSPDKAELAELAVAALADRIGAPATMSGLDGAPRLDASHHAGSDRSTPVRPGITRNG